MRTGDVFLCGNKYFIIFEKKMEKKVKTLIFKLKEAFPPANNYLESEKCLTTEEIIDMFLKHDKDLDLSEINITYLLEETGYHYQAVECNDKIVFVWLMKSI